MHVLIVDDEPLAREELSYLVEQHKQVKTIATAESVDEAMSQIMDEKPDVIFLDIQLMGETGFDLAEKLVKLKKSPYLIFATAFNHYGVEAFSVNARDYILKPFEEKKILLALDKAVGELDSKEPESSVQQTVDAIPVYVEDRIFLIDPAEIYAVSVEGRILTIVTKDKQYEMTGTLNHLSGKLPSQLFFKTHRSFMINLTKIKEIQPWFNHTLQVTLLNDLKVPISRSYMKNFKEKIGLD
ncbi:LytR/AlgR family response regulator transcription factor [Vagococcus hydrophili]|uniref:Response regulator n=1 Tax=Vagococcus hydrophili TaxID=2714947 RepID=A0A6G8ATY2_9ENTE|nr:LytTR family transcriptional regulator DNA-binding domain-containing protein [Vagococcus hydrophili]QIL48541.1 response regulator [Vagococcus hydrophili]